MSQVYISLIEISFFAHATEDLNKVLDAVQDLIPAANIDDVNFRKKDLNGYYGNPIVFFQATIQKENVIKALMEVLAARLGQEEKEVLFKRFYNHLDEKGCLYLRLDKQAACMRNLKFGYKDPIRIRIKTNVKDRKALVNFFTDLKLLLRRDPMNW